MVGDWTQPEFPYLKDCEWIGTEKVDGTNIRVGWHRNELASVGGKTDNAKIPESLLNRLRELFPPGKIDAAVTETDELTLYGEGYGARIQTGGNYKSDGVDFVLFDVLVGEWWLQRKDVEDVAAAIGLRVVPIVYHGGLQGAIDTVRAGFKSEWGFFVAEGMVLRPAVELQTRAGRRVITKIKSKDFARIASEDQKESQK